MLLGVGGVLMGFLSFGASIRRPIDAQIAAEANGYQTPAQRDAAEQAALRTRDTDGEGLTDYDELYVYRTSPYIRDTDSDGFDDKTEVMSGNDPNCPVGRTCSVTNSSSSTASPQQTAPTFASQAELLAAVNAMPADQIRDLLKQAGVPEESYANLDDDALRKMFVDTVEEAIANGALDGLVAPPASSSTTPAPAATEPAPTSSQTSPYPTP